MKPIVLLKILCVFLLSACSHAPPDVPFVRQLKTKTVVTELPDVGKIIDERPNPVCMKEIGERECGFVVWTVSNKTQYVGERKENHLNGKPYSVLKREGILTPPETIAKVKAFILNICKDTGRCSGDITRWRVKLDSLDSIWGE